MQLTRLTDKSGRSEEGDDEKDTLNRSREGGEEERARVELLPRGEVEVGGSRDETDDSPPVESQVEGSGGENDTESRVDGCWRRRDQPSGLSDSARERTIAAVVKEL